MLIDANDFVELAKANHGANTNPALTTLVAAVPGCIRERLQQVRAGREVVAIAMCLTTAELSIVSASPTDVVLSQGAVFTNPNDLMPLLVH